MKNAIVECRGIHFSHRGSQDELFSGLDLSVKNGQFVTLMGCSGCGKTTLLNIMNGLLAPGKGHIINSAKYPVTIFQDRRLIPWISISGNIKFGARAKGITVSDEQVDEILSDVGLSAHIKWAYPKVLSGGMEQKVAFARALVCCPDMLFMDEPFSALDMETKRNLLFLVARYVQKQNASAILVTHDVAESCFLSDVLYEMQGLPAKVRMLTDISTPPLERDEDMIQAIIKTVIHKVRQKNTVNFENMAMCRMSGGLGKFIDFMTERKWRIAHVGQKKCPGFEKPPDCIVIDGNHADAKKLVRKYQDTLTRFLWVDTVPEGIKAARIQSRFDTIKNWWGWENLYADLINGMPKTRVKHIMIGHNWSYVETEKGAGLARTPCRGTEGPRTIPGAGLLEGKTVYDLAQGLTGTDDLLRSLAIAAIQCVHNARAKGRKGDSQWAFSLFRQMIGEKVSVGYCPCFSTIMPDLKVIEREPQAGHYTVEEGEVLLRNTDSLIVTAQTLMNGTLPRILFLAQGASTVLYGPTCPLSSVWERYGVRYACGVRVTHKKAMRQFVAQAGTMLMQDYMTEKITMEF